MSKHIIVYPGDNILLFECNECEYKKDRMSSVAVYDGAPICPTCNTVMDLISCRIKCPKECPDEGEEVGPVV